MAEELSLLLPMARTGRAGSPASSRVASTAAARTAAEWAMRKADMDSSSTILRVASARLAGLEGGDLGFQPGILGAAAGAKAVELAELLFCHRQVFTLSIDRNSGGEGKSLDV